MAKKRKPGLALIKKANNLIEARYRFDIWETRFFLSVLAQIHKDDEDFKTYRISLKDVKKTFGLKTNQAYELLREGASSLMKKPLYANYEKEGTKRTKEFHIIRSIDYLDQAVTEEAKANIINHEYIDVSIEPEMKPLLLDLRNQGGFTFYELNNVIKLGVYPLRIYELLKQYQTIGRRQINIDEMKTMFEITDEYPLFANFYQRIIKPSIHEINTYTDISLKEEDVIKIKTGRKVTALLFIFRPKNEEEKQVAFERPRFYQARLFDNEDVTIEINSNDADAQATNEDRLFMAFEQTVVKEFGVSPTSFMKELSGKSREEIEKAIRVTRNGIKSNQLNNIPGFFITALKQGFTNEKEEKIEHSAGAKFNAAQKQSFVESLKDAYQKRKRDYFLNMYESQPKELVEKETQYFVESIQDPVIFKLYFDEDSKDITLRGKIRVGEVLADKYGQNKKERQISFLTPLAKHLERHGLIISFNEEDEITLQI